MVKSYSFSVYELRLILKVLDFYSFVYKRDLSSNLFPFPDTAREHLKEINLLIDDINDAIRDHDNLPF